MPPGGGSHDDETLEQAAWREVREETGIEVRILQQAPVAPERGYVLFVAELAGLPKVIPELEDCAGEIHTIGAARHPVTEAEPLGPMQPDHWSELGPLIGERLRATAI